MTISDPKVGGWASHEVLTSAQMNAIRTELLKAIDGVGGGSYSPSADLIFGGAFEIKVDSALRVRTGGDLIVDSGGAFTFAGNGSITGDVDFTGDLTFDGAGSSVYEFGHPITYGLISDLLVDANLLVYRVDMTGVHVVDSGGPTWSSLGTAAWTQDVLSANAILNIPYRVLAGDVIETIAVTLEGNTGHGGVLPTNMPRIRLMEGDPFDGTWASVFSFDDPSATAAIYEGQHTILVENAVEPALPYVALNRLYRIEIRGENGGSAVTGLTIGAVGSAVTRNQLVSTNIM